jgi:hypothetical protein
MVQRVHVLMFFGEYEWRFVIIILIHLSGHNVIKLFLQYINMFLCSSFLCPLYEWRKIILWATYVLNKDGYILAITEDEYNKLSEGEAYEENE